MSKIAWTEKTWNPIVGCSKISAGCQNCYAERMAVRLAAMGKEQYKAVVRDGRWNRRVATAGDVYLHEPCTRRKKATTYFVGSMTDLFCSLDTAEPVRKIWRVMEACPQHRFLILTKRPLAMRQRIQALEGENFYRWPLPNVGLGVTVENEAVSNRIASLVETPAAMRFISYEPALGPVSDWEDHLDGVDWLIAGGESGPGARPCHPDWIRAAHAACMMTDTAFFFKHWGGVNKKKAGRLLDRVEYSERPDFLKGTA